MTLLKPLFPSCTYVDLAGYGIRYGRTAAGTRVRLLLQIPRILQSIRKEHLWLRKLLETTPVTAILSDNRYGLHHPVCPSALITHQLHIKSGWGGLVDTALQAFHYRLIARFGQCWVPDVPELPGAGGDLSHPRQLPKKPTYYLGCLSRLQPSPGFKTHQHSYVLILLSGPEPQRSILEKVLVGQLSNCKEEVILVRGTTTKTGAINLPGVTVHDFVSTPELNELLGNARLVIARSGYTTVMDLLRLKKKSILIPTPGQPEQEYLAHHLLQQQWMISFQQKNFSLREALRQAENYPFKTIDWDFELYKSVVEKWVEKFEV